MIQKRGPVKVTMQQEGVEAGGWLPPGVASFGKMTVLFLGFAAIAKGLSVVVEWLK
jgi:hypothetical protein